MSLKALLPAAVLAVALAGHVGVAAATPGDFAPHRCQSTAKFKISAGAYISCSLARNVAKAVEAKRIHMNHVYVTSPVTGRAYNLSVGCGSDGRLMMGGGRSMRPIEVVLAWKHGGCTQ